MFFFMGSSKQRIIKETQYLLFMNVSNYQSGAQIVARIIIIIKILATFQSGALKVARIKRDPTRGFKPLAKDLVVDIKGCCQSVCLCVCVSVNNFFSILILK